MFSSQTMMIAPKLSCYKMSCATFLSIIIHHYSVLMRFVLIKKIIYHLAITRFRLKLNFSQHSSVRLFFLSMLVCSRKENVVMSQDKFFSYIRIFSLRRKRRIRKLITRTSSYSFC